MAIDRRTLLKAFAAVPAVSLMQSQLAKALALDEGKPYSAYILLHGLFFLEFVPNASHTLDLYVATPVHDPHKFYIRRHNQGFQPLQGTINLTQGRLTPGSADSFPTDIPQFPRKLLDPNNHVLPNAPNFQCKLILPQPKNIFAYRTDTKANFLPDRSTAIGDAVFKSVGPRVATITCLEYVPGSDGAYVDSYYAEHCCKASSTDVNAALRAASGNGNLLGSNFNLQMKASSPPDATEDTDNTLPTGVTQADENEFREFLEIRPPGCMTQNASANAVDEGKEPAVTRKAKANTTAPALQPLKAADIASCPQFGMP